MLDLYRRACETRRKLTRLALAALLTTTLAAAPRLAVAQAHADPQAAGQTEPGEAHYAAGPVKEEHGGRGIIDVLARLFNFAILAATLYYLLRNPIAGYLSDRSTDIRKDLVDAAEMREAAAKQIAEIDRQMAALPRELAALRQQGAEEIAAEEARIRDVAAAERTRLLEQARREIELQSRIAERDLVAHAADLAVGVATERIKQRITDDDQKRLVDRYVQLLRG